MSATNCPGSLAPTRNFITAVLPSWSPEYAIQFPSGDQDGPRCGDLAGSSQSLTGGSPVRGENPHRDLPSDMRAVGNSRAIWRDGAVLKVARSGKLLGTGYEPLGSVRQVA